MCVYVRVNQATFLPGIDTIWNMDARWNYFAYEWMEIVYYCYYCFCCCLRRHFHQHHHHFHRWRFNESIVPAMASLMVREHTLCSMVCTIYLFICLSLCFSLRIFVSYFHVLYNQRHSIWLICIFFFNMCFLYVYLHYIARFGSRRILNIHLIVITPFSILLDNF